MFNPYCENESLGMQNSKAKGDILEDEVFDLFSQHVLSGDSFLNPDKCKFYRQKGYYSKDRESLIKVDVSIEAFTSGSDQWSLLIVVECKNYNHMVPVDDLEEFVEKLNQISGKDVKGYVFTKVGFQKGALKYAASKGIALARLLPDDQVEWILQRTPSAVARKDKNKYEKNQVEKALTHTDFIGQCESVFCVYGEVKSYSFLNILNEIIGEDYRDKGKSATGSKHARRIPYLGQEDIEKRAQRVLVPCNIVFFVEFGIIVANSRGRDLP
jgi:hypothetical protein